ncbi:MAG: hypothetical protein FJX75_20135 [Armatimonadetes bacterium]|nr:hypothetical protein [Armatimonadota bacterium]
MSDILVRCRHCGILKSPRDICVCRLGEPPKPAPKPIVRVGLGIPLGPPVRTGGFFSRRSLTAVISGLPSSVRYGLAGLGLMAAALLALALTGTQSHPTDEPGAHAAPAVTVSVQLPAPSFGRTSAPAFVPVRTANGSTAEVVWASEETPEGAVRVARTSSPSRTLPSRRKIMPPALNVNPGPGSDAPVFLDGSAPSATSAGDRPRTARAGSGAARGRTSKAGKPKEDKPTTSDEKPAAQATFTDLGTLGGEESVAYDLNEKGQVVGKSQTASGEWHAFLWEDGTMQDLGSLGGESCACAINEKGEVAGYSYVKGSRGPCRAVRWSAAGEMTTLGWLKEWVEHRGGAITESGMVFGWAAGEDGSQSAALMWAKEKPAQLASTSGSAAYDANLKGTIVGYEGFDGRRTAVTWRIGAKAKALPGLGEGWSEARAVNADGHVVGFRQPTGGRACAFLSRGDKLEVLKNLDGYTMSVAQGINDSDQVVGYVWKGKGNDRKERAFIWRDDSMTDLNTLISGDAVIEKARRINNSGQIAVAALIGGQAHACLIELDRKKRDTIPISRPEP